MTRATLSAVIAISLLLSASFDAHAVLEPPPTRSGWVGVRSGVVIDTQIGGGILDITTKTLMAPTFGVNAEYRLGPVDLGGVFESLGGTTFLLQNRRRRLGGQMRAAATLRWRFVEQNWGAFYSRLGIGWVGTRLTDSFRDAIVEAQGDGAKRSDVRQRAHGLAASTAVGVTIYPTRRIAVFIEAEITAEVISMRVDRDRSPLAITRTAIAAGVLWRL